MKTLNLIAMGTAVLVLLATAAWGQYYTPLRYDLRNSNPAYIPSGTIRYGPGGNDPYAFGAAQYGNLGMTGNLRAGKSFMGNVPYGQSGSLLARSLPSLGLSNFRRDSVGLEDLGTGVEYGAPTPYFPSSGSVTTAQSAAYRFAPAPPGDRAPYAPASPAAPFVGYKAPSVGAFYSPGAAGETAAQAGVPAAGMGMVIPRSSLEWVDALIAGRLGTTPAAGETAATAPGERRPGAPEQPEGRRPDNIAAETRPGTDTAAPAGATPPAGDSSLFWMDGGGAAAPAFGPPEGKATPMLKRETRPTPAEVRRAEEEQAQEQDPTPDRMVSPGQYVPVSTYAAYVQRGHAAMKVPSYDESEALYAAAAALEPDRPAAFFGRVHAMLGGRNYLQATIVLQRELVRHPEWAKAAPDLKAVYATPDTYGRIVADLTDELEARPNNVGYNFLMGYAYFTAGDKDRATLYLDRVAKARADAPGAEKVLLGVLEAAADK